MDEQKPEKTTSRDYYMFAFRIIGDFGATLAVPVVLFVIIGQYFDGKYGKGPWFTVLAFVLAAVTSALMINKKAKMYGAEYKKLNDSAKK